MCVAVTYNEDDLPVFGEIQFVIYCKKLNNVFFILTMFHIIIYDENILAAMKYITHLIGNLFVIMILSHISLFIVELEPEVHLHILRFVMCCYNFH